MTYNVFGGTLNPAQPTNLRQYRYHRSNFSYRTTLLGTKLHMFKSKQESMMPEQKSLIFGFKIKWY